MNREPLDETLLRKLYIEDELAINKIAEVLNVSVGKTFKYIKLYGIETRKHLTDMQKEAISQKNKGRRSPNKGRRLSYETRRKIAKSHELKGAGHKKLREDGYVALYFPKYPHSNKEGYVMEHIYIMETYIGRMLKDNEVVHHRNHKRCDNRIENLQLMTFKEHAALHMKERWAEKKGEMTYQ